MSQGSIKNYALKLKRVNNSKPPSNRGSCYKLISNNIFFKWGGEDNFLEKDDLGNITLVKMIDKKNNLKM